MYAVVRMCLWVDVCARPLRSCSCASYWAGCGVCGQQSCATQLLLTVGYHRDRAVLQHCLAAEAARATHAWHMPCSLHGACAALRLRRDSFAASSSHLERCVGRRGQAASRHRESRQLLFTCRVFTTTWLLRPVLCHASCTDPPVQASPRHPHTQSTRCIRYVAGLGAAATLNVAPGGFRRSFVCGACECVRGLGRPAKVMQGSVVGGPC